MKIFLWEKLLGLSERSHGSDIVCDMSFLKMLLLHIHLVGLKI